MAAERMVWLRPRAVQRPAEESCSDLRRSAKRPPGLESVQHAHAGTQDHRRSVSLLLAALAGNVRQLRRSCVSVQQRPIGYVFSCWLLSYVGGCVLDAPRGVRPAETSSVSAEQNPDQHASTEPTTPDVKGHEQTGSFFPLTRGELWARWNALRGDPYELDAVERRVEQGESPQCDPKSLVLYRGTVLRYYGALTVSEPFKERLVRFEQVVADVATEIYGRAPKWIRHYGAYSCRSTRNRRSRVSEHALGNAVDIVGFDFSSATKAAPLPEGMPRPLAHAFQVRVGPHWAASKGVGAVHASFLARLTQRLEEEGIFRSMFGPGHGGHDDHLHLDVSPWRYINL